MRHKNILKNKIESLLPFFIASVLILLSIFLWNRGSFYIADDIRFHVGFAYAMLKSLQHFSSWCPISWFGWEAFVFGETFPHYVTIFFYFFTGNFFEALKYNFILAKIAIGILAFYSGYVLFRNKFLSLLSSALALYSPILNTQINIYGSITRAWGFAFSLPMLAFFIKILLNEKFNLRDAIFLSIFSVLAFLSQIFIFYYTLVLCFFAFVIYLILEFKEKKYISKNIVLSLFFAGIVVSIVLLPKIYYIFSYAKEFGEIEGSIKMFSPVKLWDTNLPSNFISRKFGAYLEGGKVYKSNYLGISFIILSILFLSLSLTRKRLSKISFYFSSVYALLLIFYFSALLSSYNLFSLLPFSGNFFSQQYTFGFFFLIPSVFLLPSLLTNFKFRTQLFYYFILILLLIDIFPSLTTFYRADAWNTHPQYYTNPPSLIKVWKNISEDKDSFIVLSLVGVDPWLFHNKFEFGYRWHAGKDWVPKDTLYTNKKIYNIISTKGINEDMLNLLGYLSVKYIVFPYENKLYTIRNPYSRSFIDYYDENFTKIAKTFLSNPNQSLPQYNFPKCLKVIEESKFYWSKARFRVCNYCNTSLPIVIKQNFLEPSVRIYVDGIPTKPNIGFPRFPVIKVEPGCHLVNVSYGIGIFY